MMPMPELRSLDRNRVFPWLALLVVAQGAMFVTRYEATIASTLPLGAAQSTLLQHIYALSVSGQTLGLLGSWRAGFETLDRLTVATILGSLLDLYAGGGRLALLLPNIVLLLTLEVSIVAATLRLTRSFSLAAIGLGLFLLQTRPWSSETGLLSVSPDWTSYCAFGVVAAAMVAPPARYRVGPVILFALLGLTTLCFNPPAFACLLIVFALRTSIGIFPDRSRLAAILPSALLVMAAVVLLSVAPRCPPIPETNVRLDQGAVSACGYGLRTSLQYLLSFELGLKFVVAGMCGLAAAFALARRDPGISPDLRSAGKEKVFLIGWLIAFALIQVVWRSANPIASGFIDIPMLMLMMCIYDFFGRKIDNSRSRYVTSATLLFLGTCAVLQWCSPTADLPIPIASIPPGQADATSWLMRDAEENERLNATILVATHSIHLNAQALSASFYEVFGEMADFTVDGFPDLNSTGADAAAETTTYDYAVLPAISGWAKSALTPKGADLLRRIKGSMVERARLQSRGLDVAIYSVPNIKIAGVSGDWLLSEGTSLRFNMSEIPDGNVIALRGPDGYARYLPDAPAVTATAETREGPVALPARFEREGESYAIYVDPGPLTTMQKGSTDVHITFSRYFVPKEIGMNADTRRLTVLAPTSVGIAPRAAPLPELR